jgi:hypothetical protein
VTPLPLSGQLLSMPQAQQAGLTEAMITKVLAEINAKK